MRLLVLGGGPAGMSAALHARELGAEVTLLEAKEIGGTSLNDGPAPVRTLARAARLMRDTNRGSGSDCTAPFLSSTSSRRWRARGASPTTSTISSGSRTPCAVTASSLSMRRALRCSSTRTRSGFPTGASSWRRDRCRGRRSTREPADSGGRARADLRAPATYLSAPASVVVVGGADTGCQLASILADFGVDVDTDRGGSEARRERRTRTCPRRSHDRSMAAASRC